MTLSSRKGRGLPRLLRPTRPRLGRIPGQWMSHKATTPDQAVEIRPDPVFGSSSGLLPDKREEGRSRPTSLLRLQSLGLPPEAPDPAAPSLGALGAGERRGGRASGCAPPRGTRITACLLGGALAMGLCLLGPLVGYPRTSQNLAESRHSHPFPATFLWCLCSFYVPQPSFATQTPAPSYQQLPCASNTYPCTD